MKPRPILVREEDGSLKKLGTVKATKGGRDLYVILEFDQVKVSRHGDGHFMARSWDPDSTFGRQSEIRIPTSAVTTENLITVGLPSNLTVKGSPYEGPEGSGFEFSSTALGAQNVRFGALHADPSEVSGVLTSLKSRGHLSSSTHFDTGSGKELILFVHHD